MILRTTFFRSGGHVSLPAAFLLLSASLWFAAGCQTTVVATEEAKQGSGFFFQPGYPEMRLSAIGLYDLNGDPGIDIIADIVYGSLVFNRSEKDKAFKSEIIIDVRIIQENVPIPKVYSQSFEMAISDKKQSVTSSQESFQIRRRIPVDPGRYKVYVGLIDKSSKKDTRMEVDAEIPDPEATETFLTDVLVDVHFKGDNAWASVPTYDLRGDLDSVKFLFQLSKNDFGADLTLQSRLLKFVSDTTSARPMTGVTPLSGILFNGLVYDNADTLNNTKRALGRNVGNITFEFPFGALPKGNYRFEVELVDGSGKVINRARDFGIKNTWYPTLRTVRELAEPLIYLMTPREHARMMRISSDDSLKAYIDSFWLKNIQNPNLAKNVIGLFYSRVEEANKRFSSYKEGWKTDMGMMFILFGPPWQVDRELQQYVWYYGYNRTDRSLVFVFDELRPSGGRRHGFKTYLLQRRAYYQQLYNTKLQDWLDGSVLSRDL